MIIEVEMHAFAEGAIRQVDVPIEGSGVDTETLLGLAFRYGQNDFQPSASLPSVSVGDIIRLRDERWAVLPIGFKRVAQDFMPPHDGGIWAYAEQWGRV